MYSARINDFNRTKAMYQSILEKERKKETFLCADIQYTKGEKEEEERENKENERKTFSMKCRDMMKEQINLNSSSKKSNEKNGHINLTTS